MAKVAKLSKLKSSLKSYFHKFGHNTTTRKIKGSFEIDSFDTQSTIAISSLGFETVYVGKYKREYQINSQLINHPSFKKIISTSKINGCDDNVVMVACEVVLFEHLLWMLEIVDPQTESLDDLVAMYA
ncbi:hypothetical protein BVRB_7g169510 [Beta vulgaris subsp. vulgaris]|nr:hypothetical protein BVRB_7g169510 [Beta vulgaris subsp. vulgaris]